LLTVPLYLLFIHTTGMAHFRMDEKLGRYNHFITFPASSTSYSPPFSFSYLNTKRFHRSILYVRITYCGSAIQPVFSWRKDGEVVGRIKMNEYEVCG